MIALEKFLEPIEIAGKPFNKKIKAYRMDGTSPKLDMRKYVGLGSCNCCDYFMPYNDDSVLLIEETKLMGQIEDLKNEYCYLEKDDQTEFINNCIRDENKLKVYGAMLVLCRLAAVCKNAKDLLQTKSSKLKKCKFWFVASGMETEETTRLFDHLKDRLHNDLRSVLTGKILDDVEIMPSDVFVTKLSEQATSP